MKVRNWYVRGLYTRQNPWAWWFTYLVALPNQYKLPTGKESLLWETNTYDILIDQEYVDLPPTANIFVFCIDILEASSFFDFDMKKEKLTILNHLHFVQQDFIRNLASVMIYMTCVQVDRRYGSGEVSCDAVLFYTVGLV